MSCSPLPLSSFCFLTVPNPPHLLPHYLPHYMRYPTPHCTLATSMKKESTFYRAHALFHEHFLPIRVLLPACLPPARPMALWCRCRWRFMSSPADDGNGLGQHFALMAENSGQGRSRAVGIDTRAARATLRLTDRPSRSVRPETDFRWCRPRRRVRARASSSAKEANGFSRWSSPPTPAR